MLHAIDLALIELQLIATHHPGIAILAIHEFIAERNPGQGLHPRKIADGAQLVLRGEAVRDRDGVSVVESQRSGNHQSQRAQGPTDFLHRFQLRLLEDGFGQRAGVIGVDIDGAAFQRLEQDTRIAHAELALHPQLGLRLDALRCNLSENVALGENLAADDHGFGRPARCRQQARQQSDVQHHRGRAGARQAEPMHQAATVAASGTVRCALMKEVTNASAG